MKKMLETILSEIVSISKAQSHCHWLLVSSKAKSSVHQIYDPWKSQMFRDWIHLIFLWSPKSVTELRLVTGDMSQEFARSGNVALKKTCSVFLVSFQSSRDTENHSHAWKCCRKGPHEHSEGAISPALESKGSSRRESEVYMVMCNKTNSAEKGKRRVPAPGSRRLGLRAALKLGWARAAGGQFGSRRKETGRAARVPINPGQFRWVTEHQVSGPKTKTHPQRWKTPAWRKFKDKYHGLRRWF